MKLPSKLSILSFNLHVHLSDIYDHSLMISLNDSFSVKWRKAVAEKKFLQQGGHIWEVICASYDVVCMQGCAGTM